MRGAEPVLQAGAVSAEDGTVSLDDIQKLLEKLKPDSAIDAADRQTATQLLHQATSQVRRSFDFAAKAAEYERVVQQAPSILDSIKAELAVSPALPKPDVPADTSLPQLEQLLTQAEADLTTAEKRAAELESEVKERADRRGELPELIADANDRLRELKEQRGHVLNGGDESPLLAQARRYDVLSRRQAIESELLSHEKEILSYDARRELLAARRDRAARRLAAAQHVATTWRTEVASRRRSESEAAARQAREARLAAARLHPEIRRIAEHNAELAEMRAGEKGLTRRIERATANLQEAREAITTARERRAQLQERIDAAGLTDAVALLLRREKRELPDLRQYAPRMRQRKREITAIQLSSIDLDDQRSELFDIAARVEELADRIVDERCSREDAVPVLTDLLTSQRGLLDSLLAEHSTYFNTLVDLDAGEIRLVAEVKMLSGLIAEHILWVRSDVVFGPAALVSIAEGFRWCLAVERWQGLLRTLWADMCRHPFLPVLLLVVEILLAFFRRRSAERLKAIAPMVARIRTDRFVLTLEALVYTVVRSASGVATLAFFAWRLNRAEDASDLSKAASDAFYVLAAAAFVVGFLRETCAPGGLAESHFRWSRDALTQMRRVMLKTSSVLLPFLWLGVLCNWYDEDAALLELGRFCWIAVLVASSAFAYAVMRPHGMVQTELSAHHPGPWPARFKRPVFALCFSAPLVLAVASLAGYHYTAAELTKWLAQSAALVFGILLVQALLLRGIQVIARRDELERRVREWQENRRRREEAKGEDAALADAAPEVAEEDISVAAVSEQTRKLIRAGMTFSLLSGLWVIWSDVLPALGLLDTIVVWTGEGKVVTTSPEGASIMVVGPVAITLADLLLAAVVAVMTAICARYLPGVLELVVLRQFTIGYGERYALMTIVRYTITAMGVVFVFNLMGIGWPKVQWLIAALSVGLGFGLQEIFANFVSGLILLFERPIRVGDYVTVGETSGEVTRIQIRATTITDWDRKELIIPNKQFVTGELVNWTLSDAILRVVIPVGIAYGSDTAKAKEALLQVARDNPQVLKNPAPTAPFLAFGDSSLNFELRAFIPSAEHFITARDDLHMAVDRAFRDAGITIAFPQRDLHVRSLPATASATANLPV